MWRIRKSTCHFHDESARGELLLYNFSGVKVEYGRQKFSVNKDNSWPRILSKLRDELTYKGSKKARAFVKKEFNRLHDLFTELGILVN
jgi:hypothetical protein